jgi:hypothetical protein
VTGEIPPAESNASNAEPENEYFEKLKNGLLRVENRSRCLNAFEHAKRRASRFSADSQAATEARDAIFKMPHSTLRPTRFLRHLRQTKSFLMFVTSGKS